MRRVLGAKLRDIEEREIAAKRGGWSRASSLEGLVSASLESGQLTLYDTIPHSAPTPDEETIRNSLRAHIDEVVRRLTPRQQEMTRRLRAGWSMSELSRHLRIPRPTLYDDVGRIRKVFKDEGLDDFLQ